MSLCAPTMTSINEFLTGRDTMSVQTSCILPCQLVWKELVEGLSFLHHSFLRIQ